jgi:RNA processing factor Prp31
MSEYKDKQINTNRVTLARARELLGNTDMSDAELEKVLENLRTYCRIVYQVHQKIKQENKEFLNNNSPNGIKDSKITAEKHNTKDAA